MRFQTKIFIIGICFVSCRTPPSTIVDLKKSSSKVEEMVKGLKERQKEKLTEISRIQDLEKEIKNVLESDNKLKDDVTSASPLASNI